MKEPAVPDWQLERYRLGELPPVETERVRGALSGDARLRERLAALEESDREVLAAHPPSVVAARIRARESSLPSGPPRRLHPVLVPALAVGLVALGAAAVRLQGPRGPDTADTTRVKGLAPRLYVYRKGREAAERLENGSRARENDVVQLAYQAAGRRFGAIVSVDGRGVVTRHLPASGGKAAPLQAGAPVALDQAYRLDDAPGFERFYFVTADAPFAMDAVLAAAGKGSERLELPAPLEQSTFVLKKEAGR